MDNRNNSSNNTPSTSSSLPPSSQWSSHYSTFRSSSSSSSASDSDCSYSSYFSRQCVNGDCDSWERRYRRCASNDYRLEKEVKNKSTGEKYWEETKGEGENEGMEDGLNNWSISWRSSNSFDNNRTNNDDDNDDKDHPYRRDALEAIEGLQRSLSGLKTFLSHVPAYFSYSEWQKYNNKKNGSNNNSNDVNNNNSNNNNTALSTKNRDTTRVDEEWKALEKQFDEHFDRWNTEMKGMMEDFAKSPFGRYVFFEWPNRGRGGKDDHQQNKKNNNNNDHHHNNDGSGITFTNGVENNDNDRSNTKQ